MFIPSYIIYALIIVAVLIFFRQFFVAFRDQKENGVQLSLFSKKPKKSFEIMDEKMEIRKRMIVARAHEMGKIANDNVEAMFNVSHTTAWRYLEDLENEGRLTQAGKTGRGVIYKAPTGAF